MVVGEFVNQTFPQPRMEQERRASRGVWLLAGVALAALALLAFLPGATAVPFANGDVFVSESDGSVHHYSSTGVVKGSLVTGVSGYVTGSTFEPSSGNLFVTGYYGSPNIFRFDHTSGALMGTFGTGYTCPESVSFRLAGDALVAPCASGSSTLEKNPAGAAVASHPTGGADASVIDLNDCTFYHSPELSVVHRFDICGGGPLPDLPTTFHGPIYSMALDCQGNLLLTDSDHVHRVDTTSGAILNTYDDPSVSTWSGVEMAEDGTSLWATAYGASSARAFRFDMGSGALMASFPTTTSSAWDVSVYRNPNPCTGTPP
ncbi:MAG: hypothetical protein LC620_00245, partial [Halobacteriales archaeon]|nr:hypothetical protein [Halobacteriales archaeon]